ncbi:MAG TPA: MSMEG_4193 family putative phosphomutase [Micromonosporaceae bacterium]|nr:MSMEG_4193 family putative phosphomutase [Micromonosporaceae bacterium]
MATVLLLRHGRTTANAGGTLAGHQPTELDDVGRAQAAAVGARLNAAGLVPHLVVTSPLVRCRQTVEAALPGTAYVDDARLVECDYGDWSGQPLKNLAKQPLWQVVQAHPSAATFPGGESMAAMSARAIAAIRDADARATQAYGPEALVLACSHGDVIKAIVADALGLHLDLFQRLSVDPASLTAIRYTPVRPFVLRLNDVGGDLAGLKPPKRRGRRGRRATSDAEVGGGAGADGPAVPPATRATRAGRGSDAPADRIVSKT